MVLVLWHVVERSFEIHHNCPWEFHILAMVGHNMEILHWLWCLVEYLVSWWMVNHGRTGQCVGMVAGMEGNHIQVADKSDWYIVQINSLCLRHWNNQYVIIPNWCQVDVVSPKCNLLELYWMDLVENYLAIYCVTKWICHRYCDLIHSSEFLESIVVYIEHTSDLQRHEGLVYPILSQTVVFHCTIDQ